MAVETKRGCGYRKIGGLYLVAGNLSEPCDRLPWPLHVYPTMIRTTSKETKCY